MKSKSLKARHYFDEMWRHNFLFCLGWKPEQYIEFCKDKFDYTPSIENCDGEHVLIESRGIGFQHVIWTRRKAGPKFYPTLAHECLHAAIKTLEYNGVKLDPNNDEPLAYLLSNLMRKALE